MATAYRLNSESSSNYLSASRSNDGKTVTVFISTGSQRMVIDVETKDFLKFMSTLSKNWGK